MQVDNVVFFPLIVDEVEQQKLAISAAMEFPGTFDPHRITRQVVGFVVVEVGPVESALVDLLGLARPLLRIQFLEDRIAGRSG